MDDKARIQRIAYACEHRRDAVSLVREIEYAESLYELMDYYNWDDGLAVPTAVATHPACDLAIALKLFWLAEGQFWHDPNVEVDAYNFQHFNFCTMIEGRIISGFYEVGRLSHTQNFNKAVIYKLEKSGFPEILYKPVVGRE